MIDIKAILKSRYQDDFVDELLKSYKELKDNYYLGKFKPSELEGGFFVECVRRIMEFELFGVSIPIGTSLKPFSDSELNRYASTSGGDEAFRLHIPRVLRSIYNLRNKRGVGHLSKVTPNVMDSTYIVSSCDWVMAELVRNTSTKTPDECQKIVDSLVQRRLSMIFDDGDVQRVLNTGYSKKDQVILLLYHNNKSISDKTLFEWVEYSNFSVFISQILKPFHKERIIEYKKNGKCVLTQKGIIYAESLIEKPFL